jgi:dephospho-CoA kinase
MKVIGLTGNIGCGKTTVAGWLRELGVAVIDLDAVARQVRNNDAGARRRIEAIKLLESPLHDACDSTWVVRCDEADAIDRLVRSRGMSEDEARRRLANQSPQEAKVAAADVVIDGSAPMEETRRQVEAALARLLG